MPLIYPRFEDFVAQVRAEFRRQLPTVDPTVFGSWARGFADGCAAMAQSLSLDIRDLQKQVFPQTATGEFLDLFGGYDSLPRTPDTASSGLICLPGTSGTTIPLYTVLTAANGLEYKTQAPATILNYSQGITSITRSGLVATVTTPSDHGLASGLTVTISGVNVPEYDGAHQITVTGRDTFTFQVAGTEASPASGGSVSSTHALLSVACSETGTAGSLEGGAALSLASSIAGAESTGYATYDGLSGGADQEEDEPYRARVMLKRSITEGVFEEDQIKLAALGVSGNTRAWVKRPTDSVCDALAGTASFPIPGQVAVYVIRDNDPNPIPSQALLDQTKEAVIKNGALPGHVSKLDLFVMAPTLSHVDFTFTALSPDTPSMRQAIHDQIRAYFEDQADFETNIPEATYLGVIANTQDLETGAFLQAFTLSAPSGDIIVGTGGLPILGNVTFNI